LPVVVSAIPEAGYVLKLKFADGAERKFDVSRFFQFLAFAPLRDKQMFNQVFVERGRPMWGDKTIDISPNMLLDTFSPSGYID
jgi:hypothetical protein